MMIACYEVSINDRLCCVVCGCLLFQLGRSSFCYHDTGEGRGDLVVVVVVEVS